jgi:hypothetical protein
MRAPHAALFSAIDWSTERVAAQTRQRAREAGLDLVDIDPWYDVDDAASLRRLLAEIDGGDAEFYRPPATAAWLRDNHILDRFAPYAHGPLPAAAPADL